MCGAEVFFYSNELGSRVYFDDLGPPWPKHPCTDTSTAPVGAAWVAPVDMIGRIPSFRDHVSYDPVQAIHHIPGVFVVRGVEKRGPKRLLTLEEIGGERITILTSPPAPPIHSIAVSIDFEVHWYDPRTGAKGKNTVWRKA